MAAHASERCCPQNTARGLQLLAHCVGRQVLGAAAPAFSNAPQTGSDLSIGVLKSVEAACWHCGLQGLPAAAAPFSRTSVTGEGKLGAGSC